MALKHAHIYVGCMLSPLLTDPPQIFWHQSVSALIICQPYIACRWRVSEFKGAGTVFSATYDDISWAQKREIPGFSATVNVNNYKHILVASFLKWKSCTYLFQFNQHYQYFWRMSLFWIYLLLYLKY